MAWTKWLVAAWSRDRCRTPAAGVVFCDCAIVEQSRHLPPLRIFLEKRPFELPIAEMFSRIPTKDGRGGWAYGR